METSINIFVVIGAALIDSINPCAIGVLIFLLAYLVKTVKKSSAILTHGLVYLTAVFLTYLFAGIFFLPIIQSMRNFSVNAYLAIAGVIALFGILELKEYFAPGKTTILEIPPLYSNIIKKSSSRIARSHLFTFGMGIFVAIVELPCTGAVYLAVLALMSLSGLTVSNITLLILYNLIFIAPLTVILWLFYKGMAGERIKSWMKKYKPYTRLLTGILLLVLAAWMVMFITL